MLRVTDVESGYGDLTILRSISFELAQGEVLAVLGHNGVGKSTLLRTIIGQLRVRKGEISYAGRSLAGLKPYHIANRGISYIPQEAALFPDLSVVKNLRVAFGSRKDFGTACDRALTAFPFLRNRVHQRAGTLSGGEQKMLLVARSMLVSPRLILADEVTEGVQPMQVSRIAEVLRACRERDGAAMLIVEQHLDFALGIADRFVLIKQGMIVSAGTTSSRGARVEIERQLAL
jgi:ABC-type branched-subunit amino acid transport system ATPase component